MSGLAVLAIKSLFSHQAVVGSKVSSRTIRTSATCNGEEGGAAWTPPFEQKKIQTRMFGFFSTTVPCCGKALLPTP
jgi:hypothetical protein